MDESSSNPYAPPSSVGTVQVPVPPGRGDIWVRRICWIQFAVIAVSLAVEAIEHESIVGSGPIFFVGGLSLGIVATRFGHRFASVLGWSAVLFAVLIVFLINYNGWGPPQGDAPITVMACCYSAIVAPSLIYCATRKPLPAELAQS